MFNLIMGFFVIMFCNNVFKIVRYGYGYFNFEVIIIVLFVFLNFKREFIVVLRLCIV